MVLSGIFWGRIWGRIELPCRVTVAAVTSWAMPTRASSATAAGAAGATATAAGATVTAAVAAATLSTLRSVGASEGRQFQIARQSLADTPAHEVP